MFRSATLAAVIALSISGPAWAQTSAISAEGAAALRTAIADGLKRTFPEAEDGTEFRWIGETQVTPDGDRYDVALPALSIVTPEDTRFDIGSVRLKVAPRPDATYAVETTLPSSMTVRNGKATTATLTIGKQRFTGVWSSAFENFVSADLAYGDLALVDKENAALRIGSLTATQDFRSDGPDTWGGPVAGALSDVTMTDAQKATLLKIAGIATEATYGRVNLGKVAQFKALMATHAAAGTEPPSGQFLPMLGGMLGEAVMRTRITGLSAGNADGRVSFDLAAFTMGVRDLDRDTSSTVLGFQTEGLKIEPLPGPKQFMPDRFDMQVTLDKVPNAAVGKAITGMAALEEAKESSPQDKAKSKVGVMTGKAESGSGKSKGKRIEEDSGSRDAQAAALGMAVVEAASKAGTELRIDRLALDTPATSGAVTGAARVASAAAFGAVGGAQIVLRGLDSAAKALQPTPGAAPEPGAQETLGILAMLQALGQQSKDEAGKDVRTYKIELTEAGQFMLNGADMSAMMGMGGQPAEPAPPPSKKGGMSGKKN